MTLCLCSCDTVIMSVVVMSMSLCHNMLTGTEQSVFESDLPPLELCDVIIIAMPCCIQTTVLEQSGSEQSHDDRG